MKIHMIVGIAATLILVGCDAVVSQRQVGQDVVTKEIDCDYTGFCMAYGANADGDYTYGLRLSTQCDGHQQAKVQRTTLESTYESGKSDISTHEMVLERLDQCH